MERPHPLAAIEPMEAKLVAELPDGPGWQYEPKWDGFRAIASRSGGAATLTSKSGKPLGRYFPEIVGALERCGLSSFVLDGELVVPVADALSFEALQARLHPSESRAHRLAGETPAQLILFDCLALDERQLLGAPLSERRRALEHFHAAEATGTLLLSPATTEKGRALVWLEHSGGALDGVIAKRLDEPYQPGKRAMHKVKLRRTADCVVGGFRRSESGTVASLLLGLYDEAGLLNHVGFTSALGKEDRAVLTERLEGLVAPPGFTGAAPGGPSRWSKGRENKWYPLKPELVVEVRYDQVTGRRFRHGTTLWRWRPDKAPHQCRMVQLDHPLRPSQLIDIR